MGNRHIIDTNVLIVANGRNLAADISPQCRLACAQLLNRIRQTGAIAIDTNWQILSEYSRKVHPSGQPGIGDAFLKWILTNQNNPQRCDRIPITSDPACSDGNNYLEFPNDDPTLTHFDRSDRKFVAVAIAHPEHPPIHNATDSDWWIHRDRLTAHGLQLEFVCRDRVDAFAQKASHT